MLILDELMRCNNYATACCETKLEKERTFCKVETTFLGVVVNIKILVCWRKILGLRQPKHETIKKFYCKDC